MNVTYRDEGDVQPADSDRGQEGVVDVTDKRVAPFKTCTASELDGGDVTCDSVR
jgi:hypothetical protein